MLSMIRSTISAFKNWFLKLSAVSIRHRCKACGTYDGKPVYTVDEGFSLVCTKTVCGACNKARYASKKEAVSAMLLYGPPKTTRDSVDVLTLPGAYSFLSGAIRNMSLEDAVIVYARIHKFKDLKPGGVYYV